MSTMALFTLGDGLSAAAPFAGDTPPAGGRLCIVREDGLPEAARFVGLSEAHAPPEALPCSFVSFATPDEEVRARKNEEALGPVREAIHKWFADAGQEALLVRLRFSLRRERLTATIAVAGFVDLRPLSAALESRFRARVVLRAASPRAMAGAIGGLGPCGRPLCCAAGRIVSAERGSARDPAAAGVCGRPRCCLHFDEPS